MFGNVDNASTLAQNEAFGPVLAAAPFHSDEEAIALANDTRFGLSAYLRQRDLERALHVAHELDAGTVWVNAPGNPIPAAPFGGFKHSGYGKQGGREGILEYCRIKNVNITLDPAGFTAFGSTGGVSVEFDHHSPEYGGDHPRLLRELPRHLPGCVVRCAWRVLGGHTACGRRPRRP